MSWTGPADADQAGRLVARRCTTAPGPRLGTPTHTRDPRTIRTRTSGHPETTAHAVVKSSTMLAIYVRTSTTNNEDSIPAQESACRTYAEQHGLEVEGIYADVGTSGGLDLQDRDALSEAVLAVEEGRADGLLVHRLDRLARELHVQEATLSRVWQAGGRVHEATHGEVLQDDADDPMRTFVRQVMGAAAQLERGLINARMR